MASDALDLLLNLCSIKEIYNEVFSSSGFDKNQLDLLYKTCSEMEFGEVEK